MDDLTGSSEDCDQQGSITSSDEGEPVSEPILISPKPLFIPLKPLVHSITQLFFLTLSKGNLVSAHLARQPINFERPYFLQEPS